MAEEKGGAPSLDTHFTRYLGFQTRSPKPGRTTVELQLEPHHLNIVGAVHGGLLMALLDSLMGHAAFTGLDGPATPIATSSMTTHFLEAMDQGRVTGEGRVVALSEKYLSTEAELRDEGGRLVATAEAIFTRVRPGARVGAP